ncbi:MAG: hydrogenase maturation nickel metallochaperone HypA [Nitrososphaerota archaeon]|nr:hydrogenase maturation nickel metallochaperone HypA [Nitrososphaerota archaeon]
MERRSGLHETGLAASVVATVDSYRKKHKGSRVVQFEVGYGELLGLDGKALYDGLSEGLPGTRAVVNRTKTEFRCRRCGASWSPDGKKGSLKIPKDALVGGQSPLRFFPELYPAYVRCPGCGSADVRLRDGAGLKVTKVVLGRVD